MLIVQVEHGIEKALKTLKRKFNKTGMLKELRERKTYEKPSVKRRMVKKKAIYTQKFRESSGE